MQGVFNNGQLWGARVFVERLIGSAKKSLLLIDNWATVETIDLFVKKRTGEKVTVITSEHFKKGVPHHAISNADIEAIHEFSFLPLPFRSGLRYHLQCPPQRKSCFIETGESSHCVHGESLICANNIENSIALAAEK